MVGGTDSTSLHRIRVALAQEVDELRSLASEVGAVNTIGSARGGYGGEYRWVWRRRVIEWTLAETGLGLGSRRRRPCRASSLRSVTRISPSPSSIEHGSAVALTHTPSVEVDTLGRVADKMSLRSGDELLARWSSGPPRSKTGSRYE